MRSSETLAEKATWLSIDRFQSMAYQTLDSRVHKVEYHVKLSNRSERK
jgi:hypothetical protein